MSKKAPTGEMKDVDVKLVSMVSKAANKRRFAIMKAADADEQDLDPAQLATEEGRRGILATIKKMLGFGNEEEQPAEVQKADATDPPTFGQAIAEAQARSEMWRIFDAIGDVFWAMVRTDSPNKRALMDQSLDEFKTKVMANFDQIVAAQPVAVSKSADGQEEHEIQKAGKKISAARLANLKAARDYLDGVIGEAEAADDAGSETDPTGVQKQDKEGDEVKAEDIAKIVKAAVDEAVTPLKTEIENIKKGDEPEGDDGKELTAESVAKIVKSAVDEAIAPIKGDVEKIKKARGMSNQPQHGDGDDEGDDEGANRSGVKKSDTGWGGLFTVGGHASDEE